MAKKLSQPGGWLVKEEPTTYSYALLEKDGSTWWAGVKNALARQYLRQMQVGNRVLYYHTGAERAIVGEMRVVTAPMPDPDSTDTKAVVVKLEPVKRWQPPLTLQQIKGDESLASWELVRLPRLSVLPISPEQWQTLESLQRQCGDA